MKETFKKFDENQWINQFMIRHNSVGTIKQLFSIF